MSRRASLRNWLPRAVVPLALVPGLLLAGAPPASAGQHDHRAPEGVAEAPRGSSDPSDLPDIALAPAGEAIIVDREDTAVAPGVVHTSFDRLDARGWVRGDVLVADLDEERLRTDYLNPGTVSGRAVLSEQAARKGAVAAVNGDFFDISDTGAPLGVGIERTPAPSDGAPPAEPGALVNAPASGHNNTVAIGADGIGRLAEIFLEGTATDDDGSTVALTNLNSPNVAADGVGLYTPAWGDAPRTRTVDTATVVREVIVRDGEVVAAGATAGTTPLAEGEQALVGREAGAAALDAFEVGDRVDVVYGPRTDVGPVAVALGGGTVLLRDGVVPPVDDTALHPRTAVGFSEDGRRMILVTIDGRQRDSRGMTERELGELLADLGADDGLNLDGGGSSTMLARDPGEDPEVVNSPSDGGERLTPNGFGLMAAPGSGTLSGFHVEPVVEAEDAGDDHARRVLTGLSRTLAARGHDETFAPVDAEPTWQATPAGVARVEPGEDGTAVVTGRRSGDATVVASQGGAEGAMDLVVLGQPVRIATSTAQVPLADAGDTGSFQVVGYDRDGFSTWVEPGDVELEYDETQFRVVADGDRFRVVPLVDEGAGAVTVRVAGLETALAVTIGLRSIVVDDMSDVGRWQATKFPSYVTATVSSADGRDGQPGGAVALDYSLTGGTATRAAYLAADPRFLLPGAPLRIGAWVHGDGQGAWLRLNLHDAAGGGAKTLNLAPRVDWTGWRYVEAEVPAGLTMPLKFWRLYVVETVGSRQYSGRIVVDDLTVKVAQEVPLAPAPVVADPAIVTDGTVTGDDRWRFAVLSDVQFTADNPESDLVAQARRTLREALAQDPEFIVINGDFVDRGFADDIALAKRIIDEEVDDRVPVHYVPGNHEASGPGDLSEWEKVFGEPYRSFDHNGTRFVLLDSSRGSLRAGDFDQLLMLRDALDGAATDRGIDNVVVMAHHPIADPSPTQTSQLADRKEAQLVLDWLAELRADTGKGTAYVASHAGVFGGSRQDGVLLPLIGNAGKGPSAAPDAGGFTGWSLVGVLDDPKPADPAVRHRASPETRDDSSAWLRLELRPHVSELELDAPTSVEVGTGDDVTATVVQDGRRVPVAYPVSADWVGSDGLHIGPLDEAGAEHVASFDPATGRLTGLREGTVELSVTVNDVRRSATIHIAAAQQAAA